MLSSILGNSSSASTGEPSVQYGLGACQSEIGWEVKGGEVFAVKKIDLSYPPLFATEKGTYTLKHTPQ
jgi:hypothetical protein